MDDDDSLTRLFQSTNGQLAEYNPDRENMAVVGNRARQGALAAASAAVQIATLPGGPAESAIAKAAEGGAAALEGAEEAGVIETGATTPVGRLGSPMEVTPGTNTATTINGTDFSGHALDQMQGRGYVPSVVQNTIENGTTFSTRAGTIGYYDAANNVRVIVNAQTETVVTVIPGKP